MVKKFILLLTFSLCLFFFPFIVHFDFERIIDLHTVVTNNIEISQSLCKLPKWKYLVKQEPNITTRVLILVQSRYRTLSSPQRLPFMATPTVLLPNNFCPPAPPSHICNSWQPLIYSSFLQY